MDRKSEEPIKNEELIRSPYYRAVESTEEAQPKRSKGLLFMSWLGILINGDILMFGMRSERIVPILVGAIGLILFTCLLLLRNWARMAIVVFSVTNFGRSIITLMAIFVVGSQNGSFEWLSIIPSIYYLSLVLLLTRPKIEAQFY